MPSYAPQDRLDHYLLLERLHRGELRDHWLAIQPDANDSARPYLLLLYHSRLDTTGLLKEVQEDFARRLRIAHPRLPAALELGQDQDAPYMVLSYLPGVSLAKVAQPGPPSARLPVTASLLVVERAAQICEDALAALPGPHELSVNQFRLGLDGRLRLLPRDRAQRSLDSLRSDLSKRRLRYLTPESVSGKASSDGAQLCFSLGCVLYELLTGEAPFVRSTVMDTLSALREVDFAPASTKNPFVPQALDNALAECMNVSPQQRPKSAGALAAMLRPLLESLGPCSEEQVIHRAKHLMLEPWRQEESRLKQLKEPRAPEPVESAEIDELPTIVELRPKKQGPAVAAIPEEIEINGVLIDRFLVSNKEYASFLEQTGHTPPAHWEGGAPPENLQSPVVGVSLEDAFLFAHHQRKRLLREAEWVRAAGGQQPRRWPWGDTFEESMTDPLWRTADPSVLKPVGFYAPRTDSPTGVSDLCRVWEWTSSRHEISSRPIIRGGPLQESCKPPQLNHRAEANTGSLATGFRCARERLLSGDSLEINASVRPTHTLGKYALMHEVFQGSSRQIWLSRSPELPLCSIERVTPDDGFEQAERTLKAEHELRVSLKHPRIPRVHELLIDRPAGVIGVAVEYVSGLSLTRLMAAVRRNGELIPEPFALLISHLIAKTLHEAFPQGGRERPLRLKPSGVLIAWDGVVTFTGYKVPLHAPSRRKLRAKLGYMAPEQARGEALDERSTIFSLGAIMYELAAGSGPFARALQESDPLKKIAEAEYRPLKRVNKNAPPELVEVITKCMARAPQDRFQTMEQLAVAIGGLRRTQPPISEIELGDYVKQTCPQQHREERGLLRVFGEAHLPTP